MSRKNLFHGFSTHTNMAKKDLRVYDMVINDNDETGVDINSFVSAPAHMRSFEVYGRAKERYAVNEEKRMVVGVMILADTPIYRNDAQFGEHYVTFPPKVIWQIRNKFFKQRYNTNTNVEHKVMVDGAILVEAYIVDSKNPRAPKVPDAFANQKVTDGSMIVGYYIENEKLWQDCKNGTFTGFSIEGFFDKVVTKSKNSAMSKDSKKPAWYKAIFGEEKLAEVTTVDGTVLSYEGDLKQGTIMMDKDGKPVKGDFQCEVDGKTWAITTDETGAIVTMEEVEAMSENEEALAEAMKQINETVKAGFAALKTQNDEQAKRIEVMEKYLSKDSKFSAHDSKKKSGKEGEEGDKKKPNWRKAL